ncbi:hypothetical protein Dip510_001354 [Elusimicrobium posterum]|uniref:hypothetical protein n=1 Tax=Elusimicrobium posterum TaxID=3116653 RepID=UPI003C722F21
MALGLLFAQFPSELFAQKAIQAVTYYPTPYGAYMNVDADTVIVKDVLEVNTIGDVEKLNVSGTLQGNINRLEAGSAVVKGNSAASPTIKASKKLHVSTESEVAGINAEQANVANTFYLDGLAFPYAKAIDPTVSSMSWKQITYYTDKTNKKTATRTFLVLDDVAGGTCTESYSPVLLDVYEYPDDSMDECDNDIGAEYVCDGTEERRCYDIYATKDTVGENKPSTATYSSKMYSDVAFATSPEDARSFYQSSAIGSQCTVGGPNVISPDLDSVHMRGTYMLSSNYSSLIYNASNAGAICEAFTKNYHLSGGAPSAYKEGEYLDACLVFANTYQTSCTPGGCNYNANTYTVNCTSPKTSNMDIKFYGGYRQCCATEQKPAEPCTADKVLCTYQGTGSRITIPAYNTIYSYQTDPKDNIKVLAHQAAFNNSTNMGRSFYGSAAYFTEAGQFDDLYISGYEDGKYESYTVGSRENFNNASNYTMDDFNSMYGSTRCSNVDVRDSWLTRDSVIKSAYGDTPCNSIKYGTATSGSCYVYERTEDHVDSSSGKMTYRFGRYKYTCNKQPIYSKVSIFCSCSN